MSAFQKRKEVGRSLALYDLGEFRFPSRSPVQIPPVKTNIADPLEISDRGGDEGI
jgi:hypothetical protein